MDYDKIGKFICLRRKALGYTQEELGLKVGVTNKAVSKWENGLGCPDISILEPLAKILKVNVIELLKGQDYDDNLFSKEETSNFIIEMFKISNLKTKEKIKKIVSSLIISFVTILTVFLIILNVLNMVYVNKYEKFDIVSNNQ
ncbi:MAG: helix-turn-helix transcriptional regulator, partial [Bacilli bacterium]